ncbi:hypothetical protein MIFL109517_09790 [Micrococcus flavus]
MARLEGEARSAVVQGDPGARDHQTGAEAVVVGLDEGDHHPVPVSDAQVHGAAGRGRAGHRARGPLRVHPCRERRHVLRRQQLLDGGAHPGRIRDLRMQHRERLLHGLHLQVHGGGGVRVEVRGAELLEHGGGHQRRQALAVRGHLVQLVPAPGRGDWLGPLDLVRGEVLRGEQPSAGRGVRGDLLGQGAAVEALPAGDHDLPQGGGVVREADPLPLGRGAAAGRERRPELRLVREHRGGPRPVLRHDGRHEPAPLGVVHGGLAEPGEGQPSEPVGQRPPPGHRPGHRHRVPAAAGHLGAAGEVLGRPRARAAAGSVEGVQALPVPHERQQVPADPVVRGLHHGEGHGPGHGGVGGRAALSEHVLRRGGGQGRGGGDDVVAVHGAAAGGIAVHGCLRGRAVRGRRRPAVAPPYGAGSGDRQRGARRVRSAVSAPATATRTPPTAAA